MKNPHVTHITRRRFIGTAVAAAAGLGTLSVMRSARAESEWKPDQPVRLIVPWPAGGNSDLLARLVAPGVSKRLGQPVVVENKPGASSSIGTREVYRAKPDGTTLLVGVTDIAIYPLVKSVDYDPIKFVPVAALGSAPYALMARPGLPANNLQEFLRLAREKQLTYGNAGLGGSPHLVTMAFGRTAKIDKMLHVPFQGMAPALNALLGDQIDALMVITGGAMAYRGRVKFFGVSADKRSSVLPEVPTLAEQGINFKAQAWEGMLAPPGTPDAISHSLAKAFYDTMADETYKKKVVELGGEILDIPQEEFAKLYDDDYNRWKSLIDEVHFKIE